MAGHDHASDSERTPGNDALRRATAPAKEAGATSAGAGTAPARAVAPDATRSPDAASLGARQVNGKFVTGTVGGPSLPADVRVGFNPINVAHELIDAIDQAEVQTSTGGFFGHMLPPREWRRHIDFPKVASLLSNRTAKQVKLVEDEYEAYEGRTLREDIFGGGESHFPSDLTKDQLDQVQAMMSGTTPSSPETVQDAAAHQLTVDAARLHELLFGDLEEKDIEEVMGLLRRSAQGNVDLRDEYERLHVTTFFGGLAKLPVTEIPRAMLLVGGNIVAADRFEVSLELSRIEAIDQQIAELTKPVSTLAAMSLEIAGSSVPKYLLDNLKKARQRLVEDVTRRGQQAVAEGRQEAGGEDPKAAQMAGEARASAVLGGVASAATRVGGREGEILRAVAFSDPAARVAAELRKLKESGDLKPESIAAALRQLRDEAEAEARRLHPQGTKEDVAGETRSLSEEYFRRLQDVWNAGVKGDELRFDALLGDVGDATEVKINRELLEGHGRLDDVQELVLALTGNRKDMEAVKRVLYDKSASQIALLRLKYMIATGGRTLDYDLFGEAATHADEQWKDHQIQVTHLLDPGNKATGSDRLILEDYMQRPVHEGATEEVLYIAARSEREYQYTIDNQGATGWWRDHWGDEARSLLDDTIKIVRESKAQYLTKAGWLYNPFGEDRVMNEGWTRSEEAQDLLLRMRLARATIRGDRERYEKATAALRATFEMVASFVIQAALTAVLGPVAEAVFAAAGIAETVEAAATMTRLVTWARETGVGIAATVGSNAIVHGDDYSLDMFKHDVLGGLGGAVGQAAAEKFLGPIATGIARRLGTECPPGIVRVAGTYGNITGAALATDEEVNLSMRNVVQTHLMAKGGEMITGAVKTRLDLPHGSTIVEANHPYEEGGLATEPGQNQPVLESKPTVKPAAKTLDEPAAKAPPKTQAATTPADEPAAKPAASKAVKAAADEVQPQPAATVAQTADEAQAAAPSAVIDDLNLDQAFAPWEGKKGPSKPRSVEAAGKRVATAKEKVENATSERSSARERSASATEMVDQARKTLNDAKAAARKAAADYKKAPPGARQAPRSEDTKARKAVRAAEANLDRAKANAKKATAASNSADKQLAKAQERRADSEKGLAAAAKAKADREALAAAKAGRNEGKKARAEWSENQRAEQAKKLGAHSYEQLHHAIELDVLDRYPEVFSKQELLDIANIRVIPLELRPSQRTLLGKAVGKGTVENPGAVKGIKFDQVAQPDGSTAPRPTVTSRGAKDRPSQLHQSAIRRLLDRGYAALDQEVSAAQAKGKLAPGSPEYKAFVRKRIEGLRDEVDHLYGGLFGQARQEAGLRGPNQAQSRARQPAEPAAGNRPVRPFVAFPGVAGKSEKDADEERKRVERAERDRRAAELNARNKDQEDQP